MKVRVTMKTPDAYDEAVDEAVEWEVSSLEKASSDDIEDEIRERTKKVLDKFFRWQEYIDVEIDTETGEAKVVPVKGF